MARHPELGALIQGAQGGSHACPARRPMACHPLPERRRIIYVRGEVEIGARDGRTPMFRPDDARLMEDTPGHTHCDLSP